MGESGSVVYLSGALVTSFMLGPINVSVSKLKSQSAVHLIDLNGVRNAISRVSNHTMIVLEFLTQKFQKFPKHLSSKSPSFVIERKRYDKSDHYNLVLVTM